jgi:hypothetical protein
VSNGGTDQGARHRHWCSSSTPDKLIAEHTPKNTADNRSGINALTRVILSHRFCPAFVDGTRDLNRLVQRLRLDDFGGIDVTRNRRAGGDGTAGGQ